MLETRAVVVETDKLFTRVQASGRNGCSACEGKGCGSEKLTQLFSSRPREFKVDNPIQACVGDEVIVSVAEGTVLSGILQVYLLPLVLLFAGAMLANGFAGGAEQRDAYAAIGALIGLLLGFIFSKWLSMWRIRQRPYIARRIQN